MDWLPIHGVPHLSPNDSVPLPRRDPEIKQVWMDKWWLKSQNDF